MNSRKTIVTNAFSPGRMIKLSKYSTHHKEISEEEFAENAKKASSHVGNRGIANRYGLLFNRRPINLVPGDDAYVVYIHGGTLPSDGNLPSNVHLTFEHVEVTA